MQQKKLSREHCIIYHELTGIKRQDNKRELKIKLGKIKLIVITVCQFSLILKS